MKRIAWSVLALFTALSMVIPAQSKELLNLNKNGIALQGYDPVAFFTAAKPVHGQPELRSTHRGAIYFFSSVENQKRFEKDPSKYEPAFGGYCAYGVSRNKLVEVDVDAFQIVGGQLLLQYSKGVRNDFNKDVQGNLRKAQQNWPALVELKGK